MTQQNEPRPPREANEREFADWQDISEEVGRISEINSTEWRELAEKEGPRAVALLDEWSSRFWQRLDDHEFTISEAARISAVRVHLIKNALTRYLDLPNTKIRTGKGVRRKFSVIDAVTFAILGQISEFGIGLRMLKYDYELWFAIQDRVEGMAREPKPKDWRPNCALGIALVKDRPICSRLYEQEIEFEKFLGSRSIFLIRLDELIQDAFTNIEIIRPGMTTNNRFADVWDDVFGHTRSSKALRRKQEDRWEAFSQRFKKFSAENDPDNSPTSESPPRLSSFRES